MSVTNEEAAPSASIDPVDNRCVTVGKAGQNYSMVTRCSAGFAGCCSAHLSEQLSGLMQDKHYTLWDVAAAADIEADALDLYLLGRRDWDLVDVLALRRSGVLALL